MGSIHQYFGKMNILSYIRSLRLTTDPSKVEDEPVNDSQFPSSDQIKLLQLGMLIIYDELTLESKECMKILIQTIGWMN